MLNTHIIAAKHTHSHHKRSDCPAMNPEYDYLFKIVLVGDSGVGKSSIVKRYEEEIFISTNLPTIGVDFCIKTLQVDLSAVKVCTIVITYTIHVICY